MNRLLIDLRTTKGVYRHIKSDKLYNVIGVARSVKYPKMQFVIYEQLYESLLYQSDVYLPKGTMWSREFNDFNSRFTRNE